MRYILLNRSWIMILSIVFIFFSTTFKLIGSASSNGDLIDDPIIGLAIDINKDGRGGTVTYKIKNYSLEDSLESIILDQDLDGVFGAGNYTISSIPSFSIDPGTTILNTSFDGSASQDLITDGGLAVGDSVVFHFDVAINTISDQGNGLGIYSIQTTVGASCCSNSFFTLDTSDFGTNPDSSGDGDPQGVGEDDPSILDLTEQSRIGIAKNATVSNDTVTFDFYIENLGNRALRDLSIPDNLDSVFGVGNYTIVGGPVMIISSGGIATNGSFNGSSDTELLAGGTLVAGTTAQLQFKIKVTNQVDRGLGIGIYENQVRIFGSSPSNTIVEDLSDSGKNPSGSSNDDGRDPDVDKATRFEMNTMTPDANPVIGVSHTAMVVGDTVALDFFIENLGNVPLSDVFLEHDLDAIFGKLKYILISPPFLIQDPGGITIDTNYNGSDEVQLLGNNDSLAIGSLVQIRIVVEVQEVINVTMGMADYNSQVLVSARGPSFEKTEDISDDGTDPDPNGDSDPAGSGEDDITSFSIVERVAIGVAKEMVVLETLGALPLISLIWHLENLGNVALTNVIFTDNLNNVFGAGNYFHFQDPEIIGSDDAEAIGIYPNPSFNGSTNINVINSSLLGVNEKVSIESKEFLITISDQGLGSGIYKNQVVVNAIGPSGAAVSDTSTTGNIIDANNNNEANELGENEPTLLDLETEKFVGAAVDVSIADNIATFDIYLEAFGNHGFDSLYLDENLDQIFGAGNYSLQTSPILVDDPGTIELNPSYDGSSDDQLVLRTSTLGSGDTARIQFQVEINKIENRGTGIGNYQNQVTIQADRVTGLTVFDNSHEGINADSDGNDNPTDNNDVTEFTIISAIVGAAKEATVFNDSVVFAIYLENFGGATSSSISVIENLDEVFGVGNYSISNAPHLIGTSGSIFLNSNFDGSTDSELLDVTSFLAVSSTEIIEFSVNVDTLIDQGNGVGAYSNQVEVTSAGFLGVVASDLSTDGVNPDPNGDNDPTTKGIPEFLIDGEDEPTLIDLGTSAIGAALHATVNGTTVTLDYTIENIGDFTINSIKVSSPFNTVFGSGNYTVTNPPSLIEGPSTLNIFSGFDGVFANSLVFDGTLNPSEKVVIRVVLNISSVTNHQGHGTGVYKAQFTVNATSHNGDPLSDVSDEGYITDTNNNQDASDAGENDLTTITIGQEASIGIALNATVIKDTVIFDYYLENLFTSLLTLDALSNNYDDIFGVGNYSVIGSPVLVDDPGSVTTFAGFDGSSFTDLLTGTLNGNAKAQVQIKVKVDTIIATFKGLGKYCNQVSIMATSGSSTTFDLSDSGTEPDANDNNLGFDVGENDATTFSIDDSSIGIAVKSTVDCYDVTLLYTIENLGSTTLDSIRIIDDLDASFGVGNYSFVSEPQLVSAPRNLFVSPFYNGTSSASIVAGSIGPGITEQIELTIRLVNRGSGSFLSQATLYARTPDKIELTDLSDEGINPDENNNKHPNDNNEDDITNTIIALLPVPIAITDSPACIGESIALMDTGNGVSWKWISPNKSILSTLQNPIIPSASKLDSGLYKLIVGDINGCTDSMTFEVIVHSLPLVTVNSNSPICLADSIKLTESGGDGTSWKWSGPSFSFSSTVQNPNIGVSTKLDSGQYQVIVTDVNGCIDSAQKSVIVYDLPIVNVNSNTPVCLGASINLTESGGDGTGWAWSGPNGSFSSILQNPNIGISTKLDSGEYQVIVTDVNGCIDSAQTGVIVHDLPIVNVNSNSPICLSDSIKLSESGGDGMSWDWSGPDLSFLSTLQNPNIGVSTKLDSGEYQVIVTDVNGCIDSAQTDVIVHDLPVINVNSNTPVCLGASINLTESGGDGTGRTWSGPNGSFFFYVTKSEYWYFNKIR